MVCFRRKNILLPICGTMLVFLLCNISQEENDLENYKAKDVEEEGDILEIKEDNSEIKANNVEKSNSTEKQLPGVAVVGVKKCGTGALIEVLRMHPSIVAPPYEETEVAFWGDEEIMDKGLAYYKSLMPAAKPNQMVVVKIPGLFQSKKSTAVTRLYQSLPNIKLLLIVRNPITRIVSHIMHEFFNPGGMFSGHAMPDIDDLIMGRVPDVDGPKNFNGLFKVILQGLGVGPGSATERWP